MKSFCDEKKAIKSAISRRSARNLRETLVVFSRFSMLSSMNSETKRQHSGLSRLTLTSKRASFTKS